MNDDVQPDADGPLLTPVEWGIVWASLFTMPNMMNAPIRYKIEAYFTIAGLNVEYLQNVAAIAAQFADTGEPESDDEPPPAA